MSQCTIFHPRSALVATLAVLAMLVGASVASADPVSHQITWGHSSPGTVDYFVVMISDTEGGDGNVRQVDVGKPAGQPVGPMTLFSAVVAFEAREFISVAAMGFNGELSAPSDWSAMPPTVPGQPRLAGQ